MDIKPLRTERGYRSTLERIEGFMNAEGNTPEGDLLDVLVSLVEAYERKHFPMELPDPVEAIKFRVDQLGLRAKDLEPMIGRKPGSCDTQPQAAMDLENGLAVAQRPGYTR